MPDLSTIETVNERMIVEPMKAEETESGFVNIQQGNSTPTMGKVLKGNSTYKEGDVIFFRRYSCDHITFNLPDGGEGSLYIVENQDIVAVQRKLKA